MLNVNYNQAPNVRVEKCHPDFFYQKFKQAYPLFKNPRGLCIIVNIYQIVGMPARRWSDRDTDTLRKLFEQMMFKVDVYTDTTHDLNSQNLKKIIKDFSKRKEHEDAQCCIVCLMSHGEEGFLTSKEGDKVILDDIFSMFNNINCPSLAGKPKLFFIQSCRDDPVTGPAEDLGIKINLTPKVSTKKQIDETLDESDGNYSHQVYHMPSLCDMLIGFPTQKGYIAYRKPEIGSWYMNAIVQVFSKYAKDTDLCAMLNMVNSLICNEVTNTGKKQMSEYTSNFTKPYFFFFPVSKIHMKNIKINRDYETTTSMNHKRQRIDVQSNKTTFQPIIKQKPNENQLFKENTNLLINNVSDSLNHKEILTHKQKMFIANRARMYWKQIAREMDIRESDINEIDYTIDHNDLTQKLYQILNIWIENIGISNATITKLSQILAMCKLNSIKEDFMASIEESGNYSIIDEMK